MLLNKLLKAIQPVQVTGESDIEITGINIDSRLVEAGQLFMAMRERSCCCSLRRYAGGTGSGNHLYTGERQRRRHRKDCHNFLWRPDFQNGTGRRHGNKWKNDNCHLII